MTKPRGPLPEPDDSESAANASADGTTDGTTDEPDVKYVDLSPGNPVSFEVPPNTNLVVNIVGKQGGGCVSSILSGFSCLATGFIILVIVMAIVNAFSR
ncbi:MAG: hypothetical protein JHC62_03595 [Microbacteriaceae bacterium]|nr:hypothetical protein [Microbacteriaceae bacterium]